MRKIDVYFLALATLCLVLDVLLGMGMGFAQDFSMSHLHSHLNLVGWTPMALFGLTYRAYPVLAESKLARVHFLISAPSGILFPVGIYLLIAPDQLALAVATGLVWLAGAALFAPRSCGLRSQAADHRTLSRPPAMALRSSRARSGDDCIGMIPICCPVRPVRRRDAVR